MLKKTIEDQMKQAMKAKEEVKLGTLRMLISSIRNREIEKRAKLVKSGAGGDIDAMMQLNEEETLDAVRSEVKSGAMRLQNTTRQIVRNLRKRNQTNWQFSNHIFPQSFLMRK